MEAPRPNLRILIVDDNRAIHDDFRKILTPNRGSTELEATEAVLFGTAPEEDSSPEFEIDSAYQGADAIQLVAQAARAGTPYAMAFMDVRMPPGLDGIETTVEIWKRDPDLQVVLCSAYADYSWSQLQTKLGQTDRFVILKKPFDNIEVLQLAQALTAKWRLLQQARTKMAELEKMVNARTAELQREITERKQTEAALRESQQVILKQERLAAVGQLSAGVAHDFNNIMTVIRGHAGLLLLKEDVPEFVHEPLREMECAAVRAASLTRQLLAFSRQQIMQTRNIDVAEVVNQMAGMLRDVLGDRIILLLTQAPRSRTVRGDVSMLEHALLSLAANARDAMPNGGEFIIDVEAVEIGDAEAARNPEARAGNFVRLTVRDTGCGMDTQTASRIFEPFFTTKDVGEGTGLGLATVYGIVKQHDGWIELESEPGRGTCFKIFFPAMESGEANAALD